MNRRRLLALAASCGANAALSAPLAAAERPRELTLVIGGSLSANSLELMNATAGGFFEAERVSARLQPATSALVGIAALMSGRAHLIRANAIDLVRMVALRDLPLVAVATQTGGSGYGLLSLASKPIRDAESLRGARIGIIAVGATTDAYLDLFLHAAGLAPDSVERFAIGSTSGTVGLLGLGRVDALMTSLSLGRHLKRSGAPVVFWSNDGAIRLPGRCLATTRALVAEDPALLTAGLRAIQASMTSMWRFGLAEPVRRAAETYSVVGSGNLEAFTDMAAIEMGLWSIDGDAPSLRHPRSAWAEGCARAAEAGLGRIADPASLATDVVLERM